MEGGIPAVLIYEDLEFLTPYMHTSDDVVGLSLNSPELLEASARLGAAAVFTLARSAEPPAPARFLRGDASSDGTVDMSDAIQVLGYLFKDGHAPGCLDAADANDDGELDISDPIRVLRALFSGGSPLPAPGDSCGDDLSADFLGCDSFPFCAQGV